MSLLLLTAPTEKEMKYIRIKDERMIVLHSFVTKTVEILGRFEPDGFIDVFRKMEIKHQSTIQEQAEYRLSRMEVMMQLFEKYLIFRLPKEEIKDKCERNAIKFIVECMVLTPCVSANTFTIDDLWKLMTTALTVRTDPKSVMEHGMSFFGKKFTIDSLLTQVMRKISYFGEFIYYCGISVTYENAPLDKVIFTCTPIELAILKELERTVTPELGIATFIIYRNCIADSFPNIRENMEYWISTTEGKQGLGSFHDAYCKSLIPIDHNDLLSDYFKRFLKFLSSESSSAHRYFELSVLTSEDLLWGFKSKKRFFRLRGIDRYLVKVIQFIVDVLLYLYDDKEPNSLSFEKLPKFFSSFWNRSNCPSEYFPSYLFEVTQLMDFIFVDQFCKNTSDEYYKICVAISGIIIDRFALPNKEPIIKEYCPFPFFDLPYLP